MYAHPSTAVRLEQSPGRSVGLNDRHLRVNGNELLVQLRIVTHCSQKEDKP